MKKPIVLALCALTLATYATAAFATTPTYTSLSLWNSTRSVHTPSTVSAPTPNKPAPAPVKQVVYFQVPTNGLPCDVLRKEMHPTAFDLEDALKQATAERGLIFISFTCGAQQYAEVKASTK